SYQVVIDFANTGGLETGDPIRFRGVTIGRVTAVTPGTNGVAVTTEITPATLLIPRNVLIEANQSGFIGELSVDLTPRQSLASGAIANNLSPFQPDCDATVILCDGDRLPGKIGVSYDELIRSTVQLAEVLGDPVLIANINRAAQNTAVAAAGVNRLTNTTRREIASFSKAANSVSRAASQVGQLAEDSASTVDQLGQAANRVSGAAGEVSSLVQTNRGTLVTTLQDLSQTTRELRSATRNLGPTLSRIGQGDLIRNLETLSANAAQASANLRDASAAINNPTNLLVLQQTLDSARVTFQNTQKITADLDELTGDPAFRTNLRQLVNGLGKLVSSTQELERQIQTARTLSPDALAEQVTSQPAVEYQSIPGFQ
ncbi:MAG TPA: MlaD family protein, partial [Candidatus Caenarcaniphilales bacterium]